MAIGYLFHRRASSRAKTISTEATETIKSNGNNESTGEDSPTPTNAAATVDDTKDLSKSKGDQEESTPADWCRPRSWRKSLSMRLSTTVLHKRGVSAPEQRWSSPIVTMKPVPSEIARKGPEGIVTLEIGPEKTKYLIHKDYLIHHSPYFQKALSGPWVEAEERSITLEDVEVQPFNVFIHWLYTQSIPASTDEWVKVSEAKRWKIEMVELKLLILADRFRIPALQQVVHNSLVKGRMKHAPYYEFVIHAYENLPEGNSLLKLLVDTHCHHREPKTDENDEEELELRSGLPQEFLIRVMIRYAELKEDKEGKLKELNKTDYFLKSESQKKD